MSQFGFNIMLDLWERSKDNLAKSLIEATLKEFIKYYDGKYYQDGPWPEVKRNLPGTLENKWSKWAGYPILYNEGDLREDLVNSIVGDTWRDCQIEVDNEYAKYHNDGTDKIPKRQFVSDGGDLHLQAIQIKIIEDWLGQILNI